MTEVSRAYVSMDSIAIALGANDIADALEARNVEVHVRADLVGVPLLEQAVDDLEHLRDVIRRARVDVSGANPEALEIGAAPR